MAAAVCSEALEPATVGCPRGVGDDDDAGQIGQLGEASAVVAAKTAHSVEGVQLDCSKFTPERHFDIFIIGCQLVSVCFVSTVLVALRLDLSPLIAPSGMVWIFITGVVVLSAAGDCVGQGMLKAFDRAVGTIAGGLGGMVMSAFGGMIKHSSMPWLEPYYTVGAMTCSFVICFCVWNSYAKRVKWMKDHSYIMIIGVITMGMIWLFAYATGESRREASSRINAILIGNALALVSLLVFQPGSALKVAHKSLVTCARTAADLAKDLCTARIEGRSLPYLSEIVVGDSNVQDEIHRRYTSLLNTTNKIRQVLPFAAWEPSFLNPRRMWWASSQAGVQYRLMTSRMARIATTSIAIDTQIRAMSVAPRMQDEAAAATRELAENVHDLLHAGAAWLEAALSGQDSAASEARARGRLSRERVQRSIVDLDTHAFGERSGTPASGGPLGGAEAPVLRDACGPEVEAVFLARAGSAFPFLATQLGVQAMGFFREVEDILREPRQQRPASPATTTHRS
mmetsp:Transcript_86829/g.218581  ORF Transcript_86829/g.218581 Transcript_86829/m.218581 type:complete len:511 (-) Transcript_86829:258-1790(-)